MNFDDFGVVAYAGVTRHFHESAFKRSFSGCLPPRVFPLPEGSQPGSVRKIDLQLLVFRQLRDRGNPDCGWAPTPSNWGSFTSNANLDRTSAMEATCSADTRTLRLLSENSPNLM